MFHSAVMITPTDQLLNAFDSLAPAEQHLVAVEILRRSASTAELTNADFDELAIEVFQAYDAEESTSGQP
jgi:hypothetical protein